MKLAHPVYRAVGEAVDGNMSWVMSRFIAEVPVNSPDFVDAFVSQFLRRSKSTDDSIPFRACLRFGLLNISM
ncbi:hypothetical protein DW2_08497 [Thioclava atlantica]|uniref:Uncharacterized protein n=1 Tax=Thioclava atlantica TaxID=1317124 RepID=A0A085TXK8_9RHOB|nr:hypothetical protein DW2_08497 [Thioclava atlantica]